MKKSLFFVCLIVSCLIISSCSKGNKNGYVAKVFAYSDSVSTAKHITEYEFADEKYENKEVLNEVAVKIQDKVVKGKYSDTVYFDYNYYPTYEYVDNNGDLFCIDPDGKLVYYFWGEPKEIGKELSKEECLNIVNDFVGEIVETSEFKQTVNIKENKYEVVYSKFLDGIETTECLKVEILFSGDLYSYSSFMLGKIPEDSTNDFDMEKVKQAVTNRLNVMFEDAKKHYDEIKYTDVGTQYTILKDGQDALICTVDVECIINHETTRMTTGERVGIVITKY